MELHTIENDVGVYVFRIGDEFIRVSEEKVADEVDSLVCREDDTEMSQVLSFIQLSKTGRLRVEIENNLAIHASERPLLTSV